MPATAQYPPPMCAWAGAEAQLNNKLVFRSAQRETEAERGRERERERIRNGPRCVSKRQQILAMCVETQEGSVGAGRSGVEFKGITKVEYHLRINK